MMAKKRRIPSKSLELLPWEGFAHNRGSAIPVVVLSHSTAHTLYNRAAHQIKSTKRPTMAKISNPKPRTVSLPNPLYVEPSALYKGATRVRTVEVHADDALATTWTSSGTVDGFETIDLSGYSGRYLTVMSLPDDMEWLSIVEVSWASLGSALSLRGRGGGRGVDD